MSKPYSKPVITGRAARAVPRSDGAIELWEPGAGTGGLLALFYPDRQTLVFQRRRERTVADLREISTPLTENRKL